MNSVVSVELPKNKDNCNPKAAIQWYLEHAAVTWVDTVTGKALREIGLAFTEEMPDGTIRVRDYDGAIIAYRNGEAEVIVEAYKNGCVSGISVIPTSTYLRVIHPEIENIHSIEYSLSK